MRITRSLTLIILAAILFLPFTSYSQIEEEDNLDRSWASSEAFCIMLGKLMNNAPEQFASLRAGEPSISATGVKSWEVIQDFQFPGARTTEIESPGNFSKYTTVFLARENRDELVASYNNLLHQIQDCLYSKYTFTEKQSKLYKTYDSTGKPQDIEDTKSPQLHVYISKNWRTNLYELIFEIYSSHA